jgi:tetratricopeptide (TPR) repeat protein
MGLFDKLNIPDTKGISPVMNDSHNLKSKLNTILDSGKLYAKNRDFAKAKEQFDFAFDVVDQMNENPDSYTETIILSSRSLVFSRISLMYFLQGDYAASLDADFRDLELLSQLEPIYRRLHPDQEIINIQNLIMTYTCIADCYNNMGDHENALKYANEAISRCKKEMYTWGLAALTNSYYYSYLSMTRICCDLGSAQKALTYCREYLTICELVPDYSDTKKGEIHHMKMKAICNLIKETGTYK